MESAKEMAKKLPDDGRIVYVQGGVPKFYEPPIEKDKDPISDKGPVLEFDKDYSKGFTGGDEISLKDNDFRATVTKIRIAALALAVAASAFFITTSKKKDAQIYESQETIATQTQTIKDLSNTLNNTTNEFEKLFSSDEGIISESQSVGEQLASFSEKNVSREDLNLNNPALDIIIKISEEETKTKLGFVLNGEVDESATTANYIYNNNPYPWLEGETQEATYYRERGLLVVHVENAVYTNNLSGDNSREEVITSELPFLDVAENLGFTIDAMLTTDIPLADYCETNGYQPATKVVGSGDGAALISTYLTPEVSQMLGMEMAKYDSNFSLIYIPTGTRGSYTGEKPNYTDSNYFVRLREQMKKGSTNHTFYETGGTAYGR